MANLGTRSKTTLQQAVDLGSRSFDRSYSSDLGMSKRAAGALVLATSGANIRGTTREVLAAANIPVLMHH